MHLKYRNINDAFKGLVSGFHTGGIPLRKTPSRVGDVLMVEEPVIITYERPQERVLFNTARDANPMFHLYESLWMLAGRNDIAPLDYYSSGYSKQVKDGDSPYANGAYGYRWRMSFGEEKTVDSGIGEYQEITYVDQLAVIIAHLKAKPESRRAVLQMWTVEDDLLKIDSSKDVCCNTCCYFSIRKEHEEIDTGGFDPQGHPISNGVTVSSLDMTVCNRSNDLIWGALGANVVHFSVLQEYLAAHLGVRVGKYNQITNNLHVYTERWKPQEWLNYYSGPQTHIEYSHEIQPYPLIKNPEVFDQEVVEFVNRHSKDAFGIDYQEPFLNNVAQPMMIAFHYHKRREYPEALNFVYRIAAADWRVAAYNWIMKRKLNWENKNHAEANH